MTTFEDLGITEAFGDFGEAVDDARSPSRTVGVAAIVVALALVAGGLGWWWTHRDSGPAPAPVAAETLFPALAARQVAADRVSAGYLEDLPVEPSTTRFVAATELGRHYVAIGHDGDLCLLTVPEGELPSSVCGKPSASLELVVQDADGADVLMVTNEAASSADDGWLETAPNVYLKG